MSELLDSSRSQWTLFTKQQTDAWMNSFYSAFYRMWEASLQWTCVEHNEYVCTKLVRLILDGESRRCRKYEAHISVLAEALLSLFRSVCVCVFKSSAVSCRTRIKSPPLISWFNLTSVEEECSPAKFELFTRTRPPRSHRWKPSDPPQEFIRKQLLKSNTVSWRSRVPL